MTLKSFKTSERSKVLSQRPLESNGVLRTFRELSLSSLIRGLRYRRKGLSWRDLWVWPLSHSGVNHDKILRRPTKFLLSSLPPFPLFFFLLMRMNWPKHCQLALDLDKDSTNEKQPLDPWTSAGGKRVETTTQLQTWATLYGKERTTWKAEPRA